MKSSTISLFSVFSIHGNRISCVRNMKSNVQKRYIRPIIYNKTVSKRTVYHVLQTLQSQSLPKADKAGNIVFNHISYRWTNQETLFSGHVSQRWTNQETLFPCHVSQRWTNQESLFPSFLSWKVDKPGNILC